MSPEQKEQKRLELPRPWCCPDPQCRPLFQIDNGDLSEPAPGEAFSCFGNMGRIESFTYAGTDHANDLRSCHYTPFRGLLSFFENEDDWTLLSRGYATARKALTEEPIR
jgi:hypothetical protein